MSLNKMTKDRIKYFVKGIRSYAFLKELQNCMNHRTSPTKPNTTANIILTSNFISPPATVALTLDEPLEEVPAAEEPVDVDVAPADAEPDAEVDELELEDEKVATGIWVIVLQVPPLVVVF